MGSLTNSVYSHTPLVITAGQQVRSTIGQEAMLANVDATTLPKPLVKWSSEPACAEDVPRTLNQAIHTATLPAKGPVYVSIPYDDWEKDAPDGAEHLIERRAIAAGSLSAAQLAELVEAPRRRAQPGAGAGSRGRRRARERRRGRPGRQAQGAGVDRTVGLAVPLPDPPPRLPRRPARRRAGPHRRAGRSRPHPGDRCSGLPLPPVRPGPLPPGRSPAGPAHQRPRRGRARPHGHRRRGRHPRGRSPGSPPPSRTPIAPRCPPCRTSRSP